MPADLDDVLAGAASDPTAPVDVDELWGAGRRRRRGRHLSAAAGGLAVVAIAAVALTTVDLGGAPGTPEVAPLAPAEEGDEGVEERAERLETEEAERRAEEERAQLEQERLAIEEAERRAAAELAQLEEERRAVEAERQAREAQEQARRAQAEEEVAASPRPDPAAVEDPCAAFEDRRGEAFVEVVTPVAGQQVVDEVELVGCASVYEGTVRYRVLAGDDVVVDDFTTATYGGPELGEFRETVDVASAGPLTLQVFWDSPADGSEQGLVEVELARP